MKSSLVVVERGGVYLVISPATGRCVEHADLNEAYRLAAAADGLAAAEPADRSRAMLRGLMPFFIKAATVAVVGSVIAISAGVSFSYALHETARHAAQTAGRAVLRTFEGNLVAELRKSPESQEQVRQRLRELVPVLKPYADDLKPLFE